MIFQGLSLTMLPRSMQTKLSYRTVSAVASASRTAHRLQRPPITFPKNSVMPAAIPMESEHERPTRITRKTLTLDSMNAAVRSMEYAILGPIALRVGEIERELKNGSKKPFDNVVRAHIGDCHAMGQSPISYIRQVLCVCLNPDLLQSAEFPADVKDHARRILASCRGGSLGSYTEGVGIEMIRKNVANFIERRDDGVPARAEDVIVLEGATEGIMYFLKMINQPRDGKSTGVMIPIPQYPLYTAALTEYSMEQIHYYLDEDKSWALDVAHLKQTVTQARSSCNPSVLVVINPGNPTGQVLTQDNIRDVIRFAHEERLIILADEVYQDNVYASGSKFHSFKKIMMGMGAPYNTVELVSFYSASKGFMGECGVRGGFMEVVNLDPEVRVMLTKLFTVCHPNSTGQACLDCVVNPPRPGSPSYEKFVSEKHAIIQQLGEKARLVTDAFNSVPGLHCVEAQGAMYAFPRLDMPEKLILEAKSLGLEPDAYYAQELIEQTGICVMPGSGFGQKAGTYHFRTTILPPPDILKQMLERFKIFHEKLMASFQ